MSDLEELRQRVEAAEDHFGLIADQQKGYSQRLIALLNVTEQKDQAIGKLEGENEQLRSMLFSLLQAIEKGDTSNTLQDMDARISAMSNQAIDIPNELPAPNLTLSAPEDEIPSDTDAPSISEDDSDIEEVEISLTSEDTQEDDQTDAIETEELNEAEDSGFSVEEEAAEESEIELSEPSSEEESLDFEALEDVEGSESEIPDDSEDALIAEIAENLELVLPDEEPEGNDEEDSTEEFNISDQDEEIDVLEGLEDPLEDALIAGANEDPQDNADSASQDEPLPGESKDDNTEEIAEEELAEEETVADTTIDTFLEENADEDETQAASPEIEDIMERISKQALSHND